MKPLRLVIERATGFANRTRETYIFANSHQRRTNLRASRELILLRERNEDLRVDRRYAVLQPEHLRGALIVRAEQLTDDEAQAVKNLRRRSEGGPRG